MAESTNKPTKTTSQPEAPENGKLLPGSEGAGESRSLVFKANLRNAYDQALSSLPLSVQMYDRKGQAWVELLKNMPLNKGALLSEYIYWQDDMPQGEWGKQIGGILDAGGFPMLRLITSESAQTAWTKVLAFGGLLAPDPQYSNQLVLDFGGLWVLDNTSMNQHLEGEQPAYEYTIVAVPRPRGNHNLFSALLAAVSQPESFADFNIEDHTIEVRQKNSTKESSTTEGTKEELQSGDTLTLAKSQLQLQQTQIDTLSQELALKNELILSKEQEKKQVVAELTQTKESIAQLNQTVEASVSRAAPVNEVYRQIVEEVNTASKVTKADPDNAFTLGNVTLNLKTFVRQDDDGLKLQLVDAGKADSANEGSVSDLTIDVVGQEPTTSGHATTAIAPKVLGLTETAARKRLAQFGLKLDAIYQASKNQIVGQAFKQSPAAGDDLAAGAKVTVIFAKDQSQFS